MSLIVFLRFQRMRSPAFEDIDPSEMENVLYVWKQQEQLHQNPSEPVSSVSSSPGFIFKKTKKPPELPPELRHVRILQPPPLKKESPSIASALHILDEERENPNLDNDDDVSKLSAL